MMEVDFDIWMFIAGLGIFLFGMFELEQGIKDISGRAFKKFLRKHTKNKIKSIFSGAFITSIVQSSSVVSLMTLAFVGAGIITLTNAIGIILGSNLGTTMTGWIVASLGFKLDIESFALPFVGIGGLGLIFLSKSEKLSNISKIIVGFGFLFLGLEYMKTSISDFSESFDLSFFAGYGKLTFALIGFVITAIIQSSSATMVITLSALHSNIIPFELAAAMVIGSDLGTTITVLLGGLGKTIAKRRVAFSHFLFNLVTNIVAFSILPILIYLVKDVYGIDDNLMGLVALHTTFNIIGIILFFPFIGAFAKLLERLFKEDKSDLSLYINKVPPMVPEASISALRDEAFAFIKRIVETNVVGIPVKEAHLETHLSVGESQSFFQGSQYGSKYEEVKHLEGEMIDYYAKIQEEELNDEESQVLKNIIMSVNYASLSAKSVKDIKHNLVDFQNSIDNLIHKEFKSIQKRQVQFYSDFLSVYSSESPVKVEEIVTLFLLNKELNNQFLGTIYSKLAESNMPEVDISSLFNVNREIYDSNKALLNALENLVISQVD